MYPATVVAAFKSGSPDIESSWSRVESYTKELREKFGVTITLRVPRQAPAQPVTGIEPLSSGFISEAKRVANRLNKYAS